MAWDFTPLRKTVPSKEPIPEVFGWWASLPDSCRPLELARCYPHIVNKVASCWNNPQECEIYLRGLMFDPERPQRAGFPPEIVHEIRILFNLRAQIALGARVMAHPSFDRNNQPSGSPPIAADHEQKYPFSGSQ